MALIICVADSQPPTVQKATAFLCCSSVTSCPSLLAALACLRDSLGFASGAAGAGTGTACFVWINSGNSSGEEDGLRDGRDRVLKRF